MVCVIGYATNRKLVNGIFQDSNPSQDIHYNYTNPQKAVFENIREQVLQNNLPTFIYIHGFDYNAKSFYERLNQISENFEQNVNIIGWDWASAGDSNLFSKKKIYKKDSELAKNSDNKKALARFIKGILDVWGNEKIFLVTHSMGTYVLSQCLLQHNFSQLKRKFNASFLLASDIDTNSFCGSNGSLLPLFTISNNIYNYYNTSDWGLKLSHQIIRNSPRLGEQGVKCSCDNTKCLYNSVYNIEIRFKEQENANQDYHYYDYKYNFVARDIRRIMDGYPNPYYINTANRILNQ